MSRTMGALRCSVGAMLIAWPERFLRISGREVPTGTSILLLRTIGIRDLVLGLGAVRAAQRGSEADLRRWTAMGATSDCLDVVASLISGKTIGQAEATGAALTAGVFVIGDILALRPPRQPCSEIEQ
jgi:hypothetical protein